MKATESVVKREMRRRAEHANDTRNAILEAGRQIFGQRGYLEASLDEVAEHARVSKGALYHHFDNKRDLFRAVVKELRQDMTMRAVVRFAEQVGPNEWEQAGDVWDRITAGCLAYLDAVAEDPIYQRVIVIDGPAVLDLETWIADTEAEYEPIAHQWLERAVELGIVEPSPTPALGHILGSLIEAASRELVRRGSDAPARAEVRVVIERMLRGLRLDATS